MFGESYSYEKQPKILTDGDYEIVLGKAFETKVSGYSVLRFPFIVDGEKDPVIPNYFDLFDCTDPLNHEKVVQFKRQASKIKACFKLDGNFDEMHYLKWVGHRGKVRIEKSGSGFVNVVQFYKAEMSAQEEAAL